MATNQGESSTQDNVQKMPTQMAGVENYAGNESGVTELIPPTTAVFAPPANEINISASTENKSAQFKNGAQDIPDAGRNQYQ